MLAWLWNAFSSLVPDSFLSGLCNEVLTESSLVVWVEGRLDLDLPLDLTLGIWVPAYFMPSGYSLKGLDDLCLASVLSLELLPFVFWW